MSTGNRLTSSCSSARPSGAARFSVTASLLSPVHDADGFALRALERARRAEADLGRDRERVVQVALDPRGHGGIASRLGLDDDGHALAAALRLEDDLVLVTHAGVSQQQRLDLAGVEGDALVDD